MRLNELKTTLETLEVVEFQLPNGVYVPAHFHVTEVGQVTKHFIDCGGKERIEKVVNFQLWTSDDHDHRMSASKLKSIIRLSEERLGIGDGEVEVEYQGETIGRYGVYFEAGRFKLTAKQTDCLAKEKCGIPIDQAEEDVSGLSSSEGCCTPGGGCC